MATAESVKGKINALISKANNTTGKSDTNLTNAVDNLVKGYGQGGDSSGTPIEVDTLDTSLLTAENDGKVYKCDDKLHQVKKITSLKGLTIKFNEHLTSPCPIGEDDVFDCWGILNNIDPDPENLITITRNTSEFGITDATSGIVFGTDMGSYIFYIFGEPEGSGWYQIDANGNVFNCWGYTSIRNFDCPELNEHPAFMKWVFENAKVYPKIETTDDIKAFKPYSSTNGDDGGVPFYTEFWGDGIWDAIINVTGDYINQRFDISGQYTVSFAINGEVITKEFSNLIFDNTANYFNRFGFSDDKGNSLYFSLDMENYKVVIEYNGTILEDEPIITKFDCMLKEDVFLLAGIIAYTEIIDGEYTNGCYFVEYVGANSVIDSRLPIKVASEAEMNSLLETAEVGTVYKYIGNSTDAYESMSLYVVEESE